MKWTTATLQNPSTRIREMGKAANEREPALPRRNGARGTSTRAGAIRTGPSTDRRRPLCESGSRGGGSRVWRGSRATRLWERVSEQVPAGNRGRWEGRELPLAGRWERGEGGAGRGRAWAAGGGDGLGEWFDPLSKQRSRGPRQGVAPRIRRARPQGPICEFEFCREYGSIFGFWGNSVLEKWGPNGSFKNY